MLSSGPHDTAETKRRTDGANSESQLSEQPPESARLTFARFCDSDAAELAELLRDPEITRTITATGIARASPEKRPPWRSFARRRADPADFGPEDLEDRVRGAFRQGLEEPHVDWYHLPRQASRRL